MIGGKSCGKSLTGDSFSSHIAWRLNKKRRLNSCQEERDVETLPIEDHGGSNPLISRFSGACSVISSPSIAANHNEECPTCALPLEVLQELPVVLGNHFVSEEEDNNSYPEVNDEEDGVSITATQQSSVHHQKGDFSFTNHQCCCAHELMSLCDSIGAPCYFCDGMLALLWKQKKKHNFTPEQACARDTFLEVLCNKFKCPHLQVQKVEEKNVGEFLFLDMTQDLL